MHPCELPGDEIIDVKSSGRGRKQHVILSQFPTCLWGQQAPLTQADALETLSTPHGPLPQGQSRKVTQGGGWTSGHWSLLQGPVPRTGAFGEETSHFPHCVLGVKSSRCWGGGGDILPFFFIISPLGWVMDAAGSWGWPSPSSTCKVRSF